MILTQKEAQTNYDIIEPIKDRWSPRAFDQTPVTEKELNRLFEAMRWAASSMNEQPWRIIYALQGEEAHERILSTLMEGNRIWAKDAPVLMISLIKKTFSRNDRPNRTALHDLGLAIGNLSVQATAMGLGLHQMAGLDLEKVKEEFDLPEDIEPVASIALGYFGDPDQLPDTLKDRELAERKRNPIESFAFHGEFKS